ncbi:uncharacterized protein [Ptychodera flava]|uniref:uncharacterized protein n=1 Tax=Ptychodera flava TaxID=63121 RepID=UPI00396A757F
MVLMLSAISAVDGLILRFFGEPRSCPSGKTDVTQGAPKKFIEYTDGMAHALSEKMYSSIKRTWNTSQNFAQQGNYGGRQQVGQQRGGAAGSGYGQRRQGGNTARGGMGGGNVGSRTGSGENYQNQGDLQQTNFAGGYRGNSMGYARIMQNRRSQHGQRVYGGNGATGGAQVSQQGSLQPAGNGSTGASDVQTGPGGHGQIADGTPRDNRNSLYTRRKMGSGPYTKNKDYDIYLRKKLRPRPHGRLQLHEHLLDTYHEDVAGFDASGKYPFCEDLLRQGTCFDKATPPNERRPTCGSNGHLYQSRCSYALAKCQRLKKGEGDMHRVKGQLEVEQTCCLYPCLEQEVDRVCATNGHIYLNDCFLANRACEIRRDTGNEVVEALSMDDCAVALKIAELNGKDWPRKVAEGIVIDQVSPTDADQFMTDEKAVEGVKPPHAVLWNISNYNPAAWKEEMPPMNYDYDYYNQLGNAYNGLDYIPVNYDYQYGYPDGMGGAQGNPNGDTSFYGAGGDLQAAYNGGDLQAAYNGGDLQAAYDGNGAAVQKQGITKTPMTGGSAEDQSNESRKPPPQEGVREKKKQYNKQNSVE